MAFCPPGPGAAAMTADPAAVRRPWRVLMRRLGLLAVFLLTLLLAYLRNPFAVDLPTMYAEDGIWTALIYREGALAAYLHARPDYFTVGNILILHLAILINGLFHGVTEVDHLPATIGWVSYGFFAAVSFYPLLALRAYLPLAARVGLVLLFALLPFGVIAAEVWGRALNAGYAFLAVAVLTGLWQMALPRRSGFDGRVLWLDLLLLLCCATNPIAIAVTSVLLAGRLIRGLSGGHPRVHGNDLLLVLGLLLLTIPTVSGVLAAPRPDHDQALTLAGFLAAGVARPLLYPLVFPFYSQLTHGLVLGLTLLLGLFLAAGGRRLHGPDRRGYILTVGTLLLASIATAVQRPMLQQSLAGYVHSHPDRYFHAQNLLLLLAVVWAGVALIRTGRDWERRIGVLVLAALAATMLLNLRTILFTVDVPCPAVARGFHDQLRAAEPVPGQPDLMAVPICPDRWRAPYPTALRPPLAAADFSDGNWRRGVWARVDAPAAGFFINDRESAGTIGPGTRLRLGSGTVRTVRAVENNRLWLDGPPLDPDRDGYPAPVRILEQSGERSGS